MYKTKHISYNTKDRAVQMISFIKERISRELTVVCIKQLCESSNRKVFLSNTVIWLLLCYSQVFIYVVVVVPYTKYTKSAVIQHES